MKLGRHDVWKVGCIKRHSDQRNLEVVIPKVEKVVINDCFLCSVMWWYNKRYVIKSVKVVWFYLLIKSVPYTEIGRRKYLGVFQKIFELVEVTINIS